MQLRRTSTMLLTTGTLVAALAFTSVAAVVREGEADADFGDDGTTIVQFSADNHDGASDVAVAPDGKIVVVGSANTGSANAVAVARLLSNGTPDTSFDGDGQVTTSVGGDSDGAYAVSVQPDGKIVVAGYAQKDNTYNRPVLIRYNVDGSTDATFNGDGIYVEDWGNDFPLHDVVVQPDGRIVAVGSLQTGQTTYQFGVLRFTARGTFDSTFSGDGKLTVSISGDDSEAQTAALQPDGKLVVGGYAQDGATYVGALARFTPSGAFDTTFSDDGKRITAIGDNAGIESLALLPDGRIAAVGIGSNGTNVPAASMYLPDGTLDVSFGDNGVAAPVATDVGNLTKVAAQPNGKIVITGTSFAATPDSMAVLRLNSDSTLDPTFADGGIAVIPAGSIQSSAYGVAIQQNGRILVAGSAETVNLDAVVARLVGDQHAPFDGHVIGLPRWSTALRPTVYWTASDDNTGVKVYDVVQRVAKATSPSYGAYSAVKTATAFTAGTLPGATGRTSCLSVRGRDWAGNIGAFGTESCVAFPVDDKDLAKTGSWTGLTGKAYYAGTARRSSSQGATLSLASADYRHLALVATKCSGCGTVKIYRGSTLLATVKLAAGSTKHRVVIPIQDSGTPLSGTIKIKVTSAGKPVTIDGLGISLA